MAAITSPTLADLRVTVRLLLNQPSAANSFWTDAELDTYINEGIRIFYAELSDVNEGHFTASTDLDLTANQETVTLPADFFMVRALYRKVTNGYVMLNYRNNLTEGYYTQTGSSGDTYLPYYYFRGNGLVLRPIPFSSETGGLRLEYIQLPDLLVGDSTQLSAQFSPAFKQCIEMYAVYKAKVKESLVNGVDTSALAKANLGELASQYKQIVSLRSKNPVYTKAFNPEGI